MDSVWLNVVLFLWFDFSSPCNMHPLYQVISLYVYAINYRTFYFCTFSHFVKKKKKKGGYFEVSDPPYSLGGDRFIFNTSACTHGHVYVSEMHVCLFVCVLWFAPLWSVNFYKHEGKLQNLVEDLCSYQYTCRLLKCDAFMI